MTYLSNLMNPDKFDDLFKPMQFFAQPSMKTDIVENENDYAITVDVPGFSKEDLNVSLKDGYLTIKAEKSADKNEDEKNYIRRERVYSSTSRSFYVGDKIKQEDVKAKFENNELHILIPKKEEKKEETNTIEIV